MTQRIDISIDTIRATMLATSTEETRYYLNGIALVRRDDELWCTATDGHQLVATRIDTNYTGTITADGLIIPTSALKPFVKACGARYHGDVEVLHDDTSITLRGPNDIAMNTPAIDAAFPDIWRVVPSSVETHHTAQSTFNTRYLDNIQAFFAALRGKPKRSSSPYSLLHNVRYHKDTRSDGAAIAVHDGCPNSFALIMPIRGAEDVPETVSAHMQALGVPVDMAAEEKALAA